MLFTSTSEDCGDNAFKICRGSNAYAIQNSRYIIPVAASTKTGAHDAFSEEGANILVNAPGGTTEILTTDYNNGYRDDFGNTSAAAPLVSGVVALMLQANPHLTYRDAQQILLTTAEKNPGWDGEPNAAGYEHSYQYGFGRVNAFEAVKKANAWKPLPDERNSGWKTPDRRNMIAMPASDSLRIEYIEIEFTALDLPYNSLTITLISPTGKSQSVLAKPYGDPELNAYYKNWGFGTVRHFGEPSQGAWKLEVTDHNGELVKNYTWRLKIYGTSIPPYVKQVEVSALGDNTLYDVLWRKDGNLLTFRISNNRPVPAETPLTVRLTTSTAMRSMSVATAGITTPLAVVPDSENTRWEGIITLPDSTEPVDYPVTIRGTSVSGTPLLPFENSSPKSLSILSASPSSRGDTVHHLTGIRYLHGAVTIKMVTGEHGTGGKILGYEGGAGSIGLTCRHVTEPSGSLSEPIATMGSIGLTCRHVTEPPRL